MTRVVWDYEGYTRQQVWDVVLHAPTWPIGVRGFRPEMGKNFVCGWLPLVGTGYIGMTHCRVTAVRTWRYLTVDLIVPRVAGDAARLVIRSELHELGPLKTSAVTDIHGLDTRDREQLILMRMIGTITIWIHGHAEEALRSPHQRVSS
ncbi:hypothetical protein OUW_07228 [Mycobacteroides abscessus M93]|nr:hypothetical protein OUW_07228 [Mycobacteroides abscessus M93]